MSKNSRKYLIALSALALLSGCDDGGSGDRTSWIDWLKSKDVTAKASLSAQDSSDYVRETVSGNYLSTQFAQYQQDWKTANEYLDRLIRLDPGNIELQQRAMVLSMQAGDASRAIAIARKVIDKDKHNLLGLLFIGVDQIARQEYPDAVKTFSRMPQNGVADFVRPILMAWAQAPEKKLDAEDLIANGPLHAYHALLIGDYLGKVSDPDKYFVNVVAGGGADRHILEMMADVFTRQNRMELADKVYASLLKEESGAVASRNKLLQKKLDAKAPVTEGRIATPAEGAAEVFYNMARVMMQEQSEDSALVFTRLAEYLDPAKDDAKMLIAGMMIQAGHTDEAIALYKAIKQGAPGYPESMRRIAELLEEQGKIDDSIAFLQGLYNKEKNPDYLIQIGDVYRRAERFTDAIPAYDKALNALGGKIRPEHWNLLYARGMCYERSGNLKKAEDDLQAALEFRPDHPYLLNYLGYSWADQGKKLDKAREMIEKAVSLKPDDGYIIDSLGWVYFKTGEYEKAVAELERAVELVPYDPTINDHLGDAYWKVGRKSEARFQWQRAMNHSKEEKQKNELSVKISEGLPDKAAPAVKQARTSAQNDAGANPVVRQ
jgi:tetratricopeptide (TPR) repeat protein